MILQKIKVQFKEALESEHLNLVETLLQSHKGLVNMDLRPSEEHNEFSHEMPLSIAAKLNNYDICKLLLQYGAHPDASKQSTEPPEYGLPLCHAVINDNFKLAHLLLDSGAHPEAYPYCDQPMIDVLFSKAMNDGLDHGLLRLSYAMYFKEDGAFEKFNNGSLSVQLLIRILNLGTIPTINALVREEDTQLIARLLSESPNEPCPPLSYPKGDIFQGLVYCSTWYGYPKTLKLALNLCPELFTVEVANWSVVRVLTSHNRDGPTNDYLEILDVLLNYLNKNEELEALKSDQKFNPFYLLAEHFCWHDNYGYKAPLNGSEDMKLFFQIFLDFGFKNYNTINTVSQISPLMVARDRKQNEGVNTFIEMVTSLI